MEPGGRRSDRLRRKRKRQLDIRRRYTFNRKRDRGGEYFLDVSEYWDQVGMRRNGTTAVAGASACPAGFAGGNESPGAASRLRPATRKVVRKPFSLQL